jgi:two-component system sensor histidine kinase UhpB
VKDNGRGLPEQVIARGGLTGIRERAMLIGAELAIDSAPGTGVEVNLHLAVNQET